MKQHAIHYLLGTEHDGEVRPSYRVMNMLLKMEDQHQFIQEHYRYNYTLEDYYYGLGLSAAKWFHRIHGMNYVYDMLPAAIREGRLETVRWILSTAGKFHHDRLRTLICACNTCNKRMVKLVAAWVLPNRDEIKEVCSRITKHQRVISSWLLKMHNPQ